MLPIIVQVILTRIQVGSTPKILLLFMQLLSTMVVTYGGSTTIQVVNQLQPKYDQACCLCSLYSCSFRCCSLFETVMGQLWIPNLQRLAGSAEAKLVSVALIKLLCETPEFITGPYAGIWQPVFVALMRLFELPQVENEDDEEAYVACPSPVLCLLHTLYFTA